LYQEGNLISKEQAEKTLQKLFLRHKIADMEMLYKALGTKSRMSVFRRLKELEYLSSYTDAGRYYTLKNIPQFENQGLWFYQGIGFSKFTTLRSTIIEVVNFSINGMSYYELHTLLRIKVQDTLLNLVRAEQLNREKIQSVYIYMNIDNSIAERQLTQRRAYIQNAAPLPIVTIIEILVEAIHTSRQMVSPQVIADRLGIRGFSVSIEQIKTVFADYVINTEKKTEPSVWKHFQD
jgi:hypothetical protein